jgi:uncharacterized membrane protein YkvI
MDPNNFTTPQWLLWAPLAAAVLHITEEFLLPGDFMAWYKTYRGASVTSITPRFLFVINAVLLAACLDAGWAAHNPIGLPYWLGICALLGSNGVWHLWAAAKSRTYSPGMITGLLLYIPLAVYGCFHLLHVKEISRSNAALAVAIGASYPLWSELFHQRRATQ